MDLITWMAVEALSDGRTSPYQEDMCIRIAEPDSSTPRKGLQAQESLVSGENKPASMGMVRGEGSMQTNLAREMTHCADRRSTKTARPSLFCNVHR